MDFHILKIFVTVFSERSISKAAEKLYISQPTITEHIKNLEKQLGNKLFVRAGREFRPTYYALDIYPKIVELINQYYNTVDFLNIKKNKSEKLILGTSTVPSVAIIPKLLCKYQKSFPDIKFEILVSDSLNITKMILNYELLLGFVGTKQDNDSLVYEKIADDELVIIAPPKMFDNEIIEVSDLKNKNMILREEGSGTRNEFEKYMKDSNINIKNFNIRMVVNNLTLFLNMIECNNYYGITSKTVAEKSNLSFHLLDGMSIKRNIYAVYRKNIDLPLDYKRILDISKNTK